MALYPTTCEIFFRRDEQPHQPLGLQLRDYPRLFLAPDSRVTTFLGDSRCSVWQLFLDRPTQSTFRSIFSICLLDHLLDRLLEQQKTSFSQMADILGLANITEEALILSRRRLVHAPFSTPR
jgi:hypothetical protein